MGEFEEVLEVCALLKSGPSAPKKCELINMANSINYFTKT